jgi:diguanylate cyclase (GGDEF)-like protein
MTVLSTSKPTILVVDDSRLMRVAARKILKEHFDVLEAEDGEIAWDKLQSDTRISLVMSDLTMPNLDGLGLLGKIRESERAALRSMPVIVVTGAEDDDDSKTRALAAGASDFITKPFESVQLLARVQAQEKQIRTEQALQQSEDSKQKLETRVGIDSLTELANTAAFTGSVEESLSYAVRHRTELALLLVQIDKYKVVFLRRGKQVAEEILRRTARLIGEGRRREDKVARVGMDSFGVLLPSANPVGARRVADQLRSVIEQQSFEFNGEPLSITASVAVAVPAFTAGYRAEDLMADANAKLALAQKAGGNRVQTELGEPVATSGGAAGAGLEKSLAMLIDQASRVMKAGDAPGAVDLRSLNELARAVLPALEAWNRAHDNAHRTLIESLRSALAPDDAGTSAAPAPTGSNAHSV